MFVDFFYIKVKTSLNSKLFKLTVEYVVKNEKTKTKLKNWLSKFLNEYTYL